MQISFSPHTIPHLYNITNRIHTAKNERVSNVSRKRMCGEN
jgi:hypothetical protein